MIHSHSPGSTRRLTLGADKAYDCARFRDGKPVRAAEEQAAA
jgi:hypothetical protein